MKSSEADVLVVDHCECDCDWPYTVLYYTILYYLVVLTIHSEVVCFVDSVCDLVVGGVDEEAAASLLELGTIDRDVDAGGVTKIFAIPGHVAPSWQSGREQGEGEGEGRKSQ
jgi:hypothetical protein